MNEAGVKTFWISGGTILIRVVVATIRDSSLIWSIASGAPKGGVASRGFCGDEGDEAMKRKRRKR